MGDANHLERMGRELKCPICLSLFNSAASLSCNHVFCNECIVKSMKVDATCPVCKIPYHRREIRNAPHMDSLVSIYKSMEDASPSPPCKNRRRSGKGLTAKKRKEHRKKTDGSIVMKPSSQTMKRVQLQQNSSESLVKPTESVERAEKTVIGLDEHPCLNTEGNLQPFFWLRDEDDEERSSSQLGESDQLLDSTPVDVPCFSDLKDSDHDSPSKSVEHEKPNPGDMFDSEMFEWTQRPCSPEILPSPVKAKEVLGNNVNVLTQKKLSKSKKRKAKSTRNAGARQHVGVSQEDNMVPSAKINIGQKKDSSGASDTLLRKDENDAEENVRVKQARKCKRKSSADGKLEPKKKRTSVKPSPGSNTLLLGTETVKKGDHVQAHDSSVISRKFNAYASPQDLSEKMENKTSRKRMKLDSYISSKATDIIADKLNQDDSRNKKNKDSSVSSGTVIRKDENADETERVKLARRCKKGQSSGLKSGLITSSEADGEQGTKRKRSSVISSAAQLQGNDILADELNQVSTNKMKSTTDRSNHTMQVLEKCSTINIPTKKFTCAFCQSSEDTDASGEMAHYHRGKPVSADFNDGSKVIHVHKNCAEWAPNVYFNKLTVVNLDEELTRSKRISCSGCGLRGAALGCYNKTCKNSFHFTCAKLIPECRWDHENFVMLCPVDASSKLPCEEEITPNGKRKRTSKNSQSDQVAAETNIAEVQTKRFNGLPKKLVLCCSGLTVEEKNVITEFSELSGVTILTKWEPSVTHVIASINENGVCKRTIKFMMGILEGKWILTIDWIKACMKVTEYVNEEPYEITMDVHGIRQGPYLGRQRALANVQKPKLFNGLKFYIMGDFEVAYKKYLQDLIVAAGGTILCRKPMANDSEASLKIIVFSVEISKNKSVTQKRSDAEALAKSAGARSASSSWVLDSIAGCKILDLV